MKLCTNCRASGIINTSKYVNFLGTNCTTLILTRNLNLDFSFFFFFGGGGGGACAETKTVRQTVGVGAEEGVSSVGK